MFSVVAPPNSDFVDRFVAALAFKTPLIIASGMSMIRINAPFSAMAAGLADRPRGESNTRHSLGN
ncbi:MAG: hypothetical protein M3032_13340 [Verrucomicrobiota bacterium]|nr:hypothetical protein [Verrucomicrobiota bacterium]